MASNKAYRSFVNNRDKVLEAILNRSKLKLTDISKKYFNQILSVASANGERIKIPGMIRYLDHTIDVIFHHFVQDVVKEYKHLRKLTYLFTTFSDTEAMARAMHKPLHFRVDQAKLNEFINGNAASGGTLEQRVTHTLMRLRHKISQAVSLGVLMDEEPKDILQRVYNVLPRLQTIPKRKPLKSIKPREADQRQISQRLSVGFMDDEDWTQIVDAYKEDFIPTWRSPETQFDVEPGYPTWQHVDGSEAVYGWEVERDMTHDFVQAVREGTVDSAKQQGVTDFMVISIIDDRVCDDCCGKYGCVDFDGKSIKEIEEMTKGEQSTPPFHFNCATAGHFILTKNGPKLIEEIKIGDSVLTHKNRFKDVTATLQSKATSLLRITLSNGTVLEVTEDHPFFHNGEWTLAKKLNKGCDLILFDDPTSCDILNKEYGDILNHENESLSKADRDE